MLLCYFSVSILCTVVYTTSSLPMQLKTIREVNIRRADVLQAWTRAVREQLPGLAAVPSVAQAPPPPIEWVQRHQYATGVASPGTGARTVSFHSHASAPSENPQVLRDVINSAAATATGTDRSLPSIRSCYSVPFLHEY